MDNHFYVSSPYSIKLRFKEYAERFEIYPVYPFTSINDLDRQISILLPNLLNSKTFYIEVGANDGITQSNTFFLKKI